MNYFLLSSLTYFLYEILVLLINVQAPKNQRTVFQPHTQQGIFVGHDKKQRGSQVLIPGMYVSKTTQLYIQLFSMKKQIVDNIVVKSASKAASKIDTIKVDYQWSLQNHSSQNVQIFSKIILTFQANQTNQEKLNQSLFLMMIHF